MNVVTRATAAANVDGLLFCTGRWQVICRADRGNNRVVPCDVKPRDLLVVLDRPVATDYALPVCALSAASRSFTT